MENDQKLATKQNYKPILIALVIIFLSTSLVLLWMLREQTILTEEKITEVVEITKENESVKAELNEMYRQYDAIKTDNDSINAMLVQEQEKIQTLIKEINSSKAEIRSYKKELGTIRNVLQSFVHQIDSLQQKNEILLAENREVRSMYQQVTQEKTQLEETKKDLEAKVDQASTLKTGAFEVNLYRNRGRSTRYAKRLEKVEVCFTLYENLIVQQGEIPLFIRIARPDEVVLTHSSENLFDFEGKEIVYSANRVVEYFGNDTPVCIYYENRDELPEGDYAVDIFANGKLIGSTSFNLR